MTDSGVHYQADVEIPEKYSRQIRLELPDGTCEWGDAEYQKGIFKKLGTHLVSGLLESLLSF